MYRESDHRFFGLMTFLTNLLLLGSFVLITIYHFFNSDLFYRNTALACLFLSWLIRVQIMMHKVDILEVRMSNLMGSRVRKVRLPVSIEKLLLMTYLIIFWVTVVATLIGFIPVGSRVS